MSEVKDKCPNDCKPTGERYSSVDEFVKTCSPSVQALYELNRQIERQASRIAELEAALKPFAEAGIFDWVKDDEAVSIAFNAKVWRNASRAIASTEKGEG